MAATEDVRIPLKLARSRFTTPYISSFWCDGLSLLEPGSEEK